MIVGCATLFAPAFAVQAQESNGISGFQPADMNHNQSQDATFTNEASGGDDWRLGLTGWIWLVGADGDVGVRNRTANVSATFIDILEDTDSAFKFAGRMEIGKDRLGAFIDGTYIRLRADDQSFAPLGITGIDVISRQTVIDFGLMYRLGEWERPEATVRDRLNTTLDLYAGGRYSHIEIELRHASFPSVRSDREWLDPIVGAKLTHPLSHRWHTVLAGDIGGFGVESDLTWSSTGVLGYDFPVLNNRATIYAGYRAIGWDFSEGSGTERFVFDVIQHGPIIGFSLSF